MNSNSIEIFFFSFTLAISVGPIAILIINKCISQGFKSGAFCAIAASAGDITFAFIAYNFYSAVIGLMNIDHYEIQLISSIVLALFGVYMIYSSQRIKPASSRPNLNISNNDIILTYLLTLSNPLTIIAFLGLIGQINLGQYSFMNEMIFLLLILSGSLLAQFIIVGISLLIRYFIGESILNQKLFRQVSAIASGLTITCFGLHKLIAF